MSIARNTIITAAGALTTIVVTVLTIPLYIELIGHERYGVLAIIWTILTYFQMVELGVSGAMVQRLASGELSPPSRIELYWTGFTMNAVMGLIGAGLLLLLFNPIISMMSFSTPVVRAELVASGWVIAALVFVMAVRAVNNGVLYGTERFAALAILSTLETIASALVPLTIAVAGSVNIFWLVLSIFVVRVFFLLVSFIAMLPGLPGFRFGLGRIIYFRGLLSFGFWLWLMGVIGSLLMYFDRFLIGSILGVAQVPYYSVPQTIFQQASHVPRALASVLFPRFSGVTADNDATVLAVRAMDSMCIVITPISVVSILIMEPLLAKWLTADFAERAGVVGAIVMASLLPSALARIVVSQLNGRSKPNLVVRAQLAELLPYGFVLYLFATKFGLVGVAAAWSLRVAADAVILAQMANLLGPMLRRLLIPVLVIGVALGIAVGHEISDESRWVETFLLVGCVITWAFLYMPADLVRVFKRVPVFRSLPAGRLNRAR